VYIIKHYKRLYARLCGVLRHRSWRRLKGRLERRREFIKDRQQQQQLPRSHTHERTHHTYTYVG